MIKPRGAAGVFRPEKFARRSKIPKRIRCKTGVDQQNVARSQLTRLHSVPSPTRASTAFKALYSCRSTRPHTDYAMSDTGHPSTLGRRVRRHQPASDIDHASCPHWVKSRYIRPL